MTARNQSAKTISIKPPRFASVGAEQRAWLADYDVEGMSDTDTLAEVETWLAAYDEWQGIQFDPDDYDPRVAYAANCATHLVECFPNSRVRSATYSEAAGEDLAGYSADILRQITKTMRQTRKTLPTIAELREACEDEASARRKQFRVFRDVLAGYHAEIARGTARVERIAAQMAEIGSDVTAGDILDMCAELTWVPAGWLPRSTRIMTRMRTDDGCIDCLYRPGVIHAVLVAVESGHVGASAWIERTIPAVKGISARRLSVDDGSLNLEADAKEQLLIDEAWTIVGSG